MGMWIPPTKLQENCRETPVRQSPGNAHYERNPLKEFVGKG